MIGSLRGDLGDLRQRGDSAEAVIDVNGVGYRVVLAPGTAAAVAARHGPVELRVHTHVRESAITLYGFATTGELYAFEVLLGAHGVGPALAMAMIATLGPAELARAVADGDLDALSRVPGVGRKTAARLVVDLGPRLETLGAGLVEPGSADGAAPLRGAGSDRTTRRQQVGEALAGLGYAPEEVRRALEVLPEEGTLEELLRAALGALAPIR